MLELKSNIQHKLPSDRNFGNTFSIIFFIIFLYFFIFTDNILVVSLSLVLSILFFIKKIKIKIRLLIIKTNMSWINVRNSYIS